jgi:hypothetical protein
MIGHCESNKIRISLKLRKLFLLIPVLQSILWVETSVEAIY